MNLGADIYHGFCHLSYVFILYRAVTHSVWDIETEEIMTDGAITSSSCENHTKKYTQGADKSLARPGRKQARKHVRDAREFKNIETRVVIKFFSPCKARRRRKFTPF